jgi:hypothetical protein
MNRRSLFAAIAGLTSMVGAASVAGSAAARQAKKNPIVLYCDLAVDPAREQEMLKAFHEVFKPTAVKFKGFVDLKMLKLRTVVQGGPALAPGVNYRFQLTYESEALRQFWIASPEHKHVWPLIENTVIDKDYLVLLTDSV